MLFACKIRWQIGARITWINLFVEGELYFDKTYLHNYPESSCITLMDYRITIVAKQQTSKDFRPCGGVGRIKNSNTNLIGWQLAFENL